MSKNLIYKLLKGEKLNRNEFYQLLTLECDEKERLFNESSKVRNQLYGNKVYVRGVIELSNHCKCTCKFCGNSAKSSVNRYRMTEDEVINSIKIGQKNGIDIIHLAAGNDESIDKKYLVNIIKYCIDQNLKLELALGHKRLSIYQELFNLGAKRYIIKFETSNKDLFKHVKNCQINFDNLLENIEELKKIGYQVGSGNIIGIPGQSLEDIANDLVLIQNLDLDMSSTSVFIPNKDSEFKNNIRGDEELALKYLAITNLIYSNKKISIPTNSTLGDKNKCKALSIASNMITLNLTDSKYENMYSIYSGKDRFKAKLNSVERYIKQANKERISFKEFENI